MRKTMRDRNRWFTAVAMTCLSGFALCGCTSGSRDLSSSLSETAGREAIEAERHVAERKKQETNGAKSKELLASKSRATQPSVEGTTSKTTGKSTEFASKSSTKPKQGRASLDDVDLETADWAGEDLDRQVQTVSGDDEEGVVETAEPLLDRQRRPPTTADLFNEDEATVKVPKPSSSSEMPQQRPGRASFDGTSEHPWSQKAPTATRSTMTTQPAAQQPLADIESSEATAVPVPRVGSPPKTKPPAVNPAQPDESQQAEAKARVQTLLTQSKSLLNKGEHRSAFRVAQLAQRIADSENLFFAAGEEQPADLVRSVLMKIRSDEQQRASALGHSAGKSEEPVSRSAQPASRTIGGSTRPGTPFADRPTAVDEADSAESNNTPWAVTKKKPPVQPVMRISPGSSSRGSRFNDQFPKSRTEWQSTPNEPQTLANSEEEVAPGLARAKDGRRDVSSISQAKLSALPTTEGLSEKTSGLSDHEHVPLPFPAKTPTRQSAQRFEERESTNPELLAVAADWRTQDLNDVATGRQPLLVAPLPPEEPLIPSALSQTADDLFAVEVEEPATDQPASRLWMILAAAAGAFAMLFVRRRPVPVVRASGDSR